MHTTECIYHASTGCTCPATAYLSHHTCFQSLPKTHRMILPRVDAVCKQIDDIPHDDAVGRVEAGQNFCNVVSLALVKRCPLRTIATLSDLLCGTGPHASCTDYASLGF